MFKTEFFGKLIKHIWYENNNINYYQPKQMIFLIKDYNNYHITPKYEKLNLFL
jgi:hypothetical protein